MQLSSTFCKINSIWVAQPWETPKEAEISQQPRRRNRVGGSGAPSLQPCQICSRTREDGKDSSQQARSKTEVWCVLFHLTGAYEPPPADSVICCAALLIPQGAGAFLPDPFCAGSQGFLPTPSDLKCTSTFSPQFLHIYKKSEHVLYSPPSLLCEDSATAQDFGLIWMQITYHLLALTNTISYYFFLQHTQVGFIQTWTAAGILSLLCVWYLQGTWNCHMHGNVLLCFYVTLYYYSAESLLIAL